MKSFLPAILAGCVFIQTSFAQDTQDIVTDEVVVTATRFEEKPADLPVNVQVITAEQIRQSGARTLPELLGRQVGIYTRDNTGSPNRQIDLRGFGTSGDQNSLILVDGQRISEYEQTTANLASVPLSSVERIEIVRGGAGAVLYGGGASGGTVNIVTRAPKPGERQAYIRGAAGNYGTSVVGAGGTLSGERFGLSIDADRYDSDNYRDNNAITEDNVSVGGQYLGERGPASLRVSHSEQDLRLPGARTEAQLESDRRGTSTPDDFSSLDADRVVASTTQRFQFGELGLDLGYRERHSVGEVFGGTIDTRGRIKSASPRIKLPFEVFSRRNALVIGYDWEDWDYDSTAVFGGFPSNTVSTQENQAFYLKDTIALTSSTTLSAGFREQRSETTSEEIVGLTPEQDQKRTLHAYDVAVRQAFGEQWGVYARAGKSFRLGNVDDNRFRTTLLEPQTSDDQELGFDYSASRASLRVAAYRMRLENEIMFVPVVPFTTVNLPPTKREGVEIDFSLSLADELAFSGNYTLTIAEFREGALNGNTVPLVPRHRANAGLTWKPVAAANITARVSYVGEQYFDNDQSNTFGRKMPAYTVTDLIASFTSGSWTLNAAVYNLLNEKYFSYGVAGATTFNAYPEAERSFLLGAEYRFGP